MKNKGLEGLVVADSSISSIIGTTLKYRGYTIEDLAAHAEFEEVIYLLWFDKLPTKEELTHFKKEMSKEFELPQNFLDIMKAFPMDSHPMGVLRSAISTLALFDQDVENNNYQNNLLKAIKLQAKMLTVVATIGRLRKGLEPIVPKTDLSYAENFLYVLNGKVPSSLEAEAINKALILHADHEFNASTFSSRVTVATLTDMYSGITSAIGTLKGPLHGGANEQVMHMLDEIGNVENVIPYIQRKIENKEKVMGMGHRVYKEGDPRAFILKEMSKKICEQTGNEKLYEMSAMIEDLFFKEKGLKPNVDFYSASMYHSLGIEKEMFTPLFAVSRTAGWIAHMLEQYQNNRLIRPRSEYVGKTNETYVPIDER